MPPNKQSKNSGGYVESSYISSSALKKQLVSGFIITTLLTLLFFGLLISFADAWGTSVNITFSGAWGDYELWSDTPLAWTDSWMNRAANNPVGTTSRLGFRRADGGTYYSSYSTFSYSHMDAILNRFDEAGVKVIFDLHEEGEGCTDPTIKTWWSDVANHYKDDDRVVAFGLFNEPLGNDPAIMVNFYADVAKEIWSQDSGRIVIFPMPFLMSFNSYAGGYDARATTFMNLIDSTGILDDPRLMIDCSHPYYFENNNDNNMNPTQRAAWYAASEIAPIVARVGASRCWIGETFYGKWAAGYTPALQAEWLRAIVTEASNLDVNIQPIILYNSIRSQEDAALSGLTPAFATVQVPPSGSYPTPSPTIPAPSPTGYPSPTPTSANSTLAPTAMPFPTPAPTVSPTPTATPMAAATPTPTPLYYPERYYEGYVNKSRYSLWR